MGKIFSTVEELMGNTPMLRLEKLELLFSSRARIYAKLEYFNPAGSVKDRVARQMLNAAEDAGLVGSNTVIIEPTSGNTGIGLCAVCASRGYRVIIVMPDSMSVERRRLMSAYGAELVLTPGELGMKGAIAEAERLAALYPDSFIPSQFDNPSNPEAHRLTTGPEIYEDMNGRVDCFIAGVGTGGTITGVGEYLKSKKPDCRIIAVEPDTSAVLSGEPAGKHGIQGIGAGFIPSVLNTDIYDGIIKVTKEAAYECARALAKECGILVGISSGAALFAAIVTSRAADMAGKNIVVLLPDGGERYLSSDLFE